MLCLGNAARKASQAVVPHVARRSSSTETACPLHQHPLLKQPYSITLTGKQSQAEEDERPAVSQAEECLCRLLRVELLTYAVSETGTRSLCEAVWVFL